MSRARAPHPFAPVQWYRFDAATFALGRGEVAVDEGVSIGLYDAERCIFDALRAALQVLL